MFMTMCQSSVNIICISMIYIIYNIHIYTYIYIYTGMDTGFCSGGGNSGASSHKISPPPELLMEDSRTTYIFFVILSLNRVFLGWIDNKNVFVPPPLGAQRGDKIQFLCFPSWTAQGGKHKPPLWILSCIYIRPGLVSDYDTDWFAWLE